MRLSEQAATPPAASARRRDLTPAAVLGLGVNGLGVVRSLGRNGIPVLGFYQRLHEAGRFSRYCMALQVPDPFQEPERVLQVLLDSAEGRDRPPLMATSDLYVEFISTYREPLQRRYRFQICDPDTVTMMLEKEGIRLLAERFGVPVPPTRFPQGVSDLRAIEGDLRFPCILKPLNTFSVRFPDGAKNLVTADFQELLGFFQVHPECLGRTIVQEIVRGGDDHLYVCAAYFDANSEPRALYTGRKVRQYPPDYGVACYSESIAVPEIEEITTRFLKAIGFRGPVAAEYARDRLTGSFYLLEVNPRSILPNRLFADCGVNLAYTEYCDLMGWSLPRQRLRQRDGIRWIDFQKDMSSFWRKRRNRELSWSSWVRSVVRARSFAYFDPADLKPFLYASRIFAESLVVFAARLFRRAEAKAS